MYDLPHFKADNENDVYAFMHAHPFITLCGCDKNQSPVATHIPVLLEERDEKLFFRAHVMRGQIHTEAFAQNPNVLAIFSGAHTYVSASWYKQKNIGSTWNYQAVHAHGKLRFLDDEALHHLLVKLTEKYEGKNSPSLVKDMKPGYVSAMMKHIIAFEVEITKIEHVFKLSQNRDEESYHNIIRHLFSADEADANQIASIMTERKNL